ncbi:MAG: hypothetical protein AAF499_13345 [Pseudomonadota bacterium]
MPLFHSGGSTSEAFEDLLSICPGGGSSGGSGSGSEGGSGSSGDGAGFSLGGGGSSGSGHAAAAAGSLSVWTLLLGLVPLARRVARRLGLAFSR